MEHDHCGTCCPASSAAWRLQGLLTCMSPSLNGGKPSIKTWMTIQCVRLPIILSQARGGDCASLVHAGLTM